jgi:hypothetical protein
VESVYIGDANGAGAMPSRAEFRATVLETSAIA